MGSLFIAILVIIVLVSLFYKNDDNYEKEQKEKEIILKLKRRYQEALKGVDKTKALKFGRDYYAYLRNSRSLSTADEQAIAKDIANMEQNPSSV